MVACVHVARILPGKRDEFVQRIKDALGANPEGLRSFGFRRITSFTTEETSADGESLLVTVYEADDASVVERLYALEGVLEQERKAHGVLVAPHDHESVPKSVAFLDLRLDDA